MRGFTLIYFRTSLSSHLVTCLYDTFQHRPWLNQTLETENIFFPFINRENVGPLASIYSKKIKYLPSISAAIKHHFSYTNLRIL